MRIVFAIDPIGFTCVGSRFFRDSSVLCFGDRWSLLLFLQPHLHWSFNPNYATATCFYPLHLTVAPLDPLHLYLSAFLRSVSFYARCPSPVSLLSVPSCFFSLHLCFQQAGWYLKGMTAAWFYGYLRSTCGGVCCAVIMELRVMIAVWQS